MSLPSFYTTVNVTHEVLSLSHFQITNPRFIFAVRYCFIRLIVIKLLTVYLNNRVYLQLIRIDHITIIVIMKYLLSYAFRLCHHCLITCLSDVFPVVVGETILCKWLANLIRECMLSLVLQVEYWVNYLV